MIISYSKQKLIILLVAGLTLCSLVIAAFGTIPAKAADSSHQKEVYTYHSPLLAKTGKGKVVQPQVAGEYCDTTSNITIDTTMHEVDFNSTTNCNVVATYIRHTFLVQDYDANANYWEESYCSPLAASASDTSYLRDPGNFCLFNRGTEVRILDSTYAYDANGNIADGSVLKGPWVV